ncbi:MAG: hypothetical protein ABFD92_11410 [Planctomycetaceae bacterium]|nr:hypothetical protein [Planctomycetaceae bacterium]
MKGKTVKLAPRRRGRRRRWAHEYLAPVAPSPPLPPAGELAGLLARDPHRYGMIWAAASRNAMPVVLLDMQNIQTSVTRKVLVLVDTGADVSTLTASSADDLGIERAMHPGDVAAVVRDAGGAPMIGLRRWVQVYLDDRPFMVPVIVPPRNVADEAPAARPLAAMPQYNILGRARVLEGYALTFSARRLSAAPTW